MKAEQKLKACPVHRHVFKLNGWRVDGSSKLCCAAGSFQSVSPLMDAGVFGSKMAEMWKIVKLTSATMSFSFFNERKTKSEIPNQ